MRRLVVDRPPSIAATWSRRLAVFALAVMVLAVGMSRLGRIDPPAALVVIGTALAIAAAAIALAGAAFIRIWRDGSPGFGRAVTGLLVAILLAGYPIVLAVQSLRLPRLNDISTDIADPPPFARSRRALDLRGGRIPPEIPAATRAVQRSPYPEVEPIVLALTPQESFALVQKAAGQSGFTIIESLMPGGRIGTGRVEAIDHSLVMRFPEDVTIRLRPTASGTRIDIRSASPLLAHDFGANARRITAFARMLEDLADAK